MFGRRIICIKSTRISSFLSWKGEGLQKGRVMIQNILEKMSGGDLSIWLVSLLVMPGWCELKATTCVRQINVIKSRMRSSSKLELTFN